MTAKTKWPEKVWVQKWDSGSLSAHRVHRIAGKDSMRYRLGNDVAKLKREHAMMKRFFTARNWADRHEAFKIIRCKMPKLFKE